LKDTLNRIKARFHAIPNQDARARVGCRDFVAGLVLCFCRDRGKRRSLECIRRYLMNLLDLSISRGAFWERLAARRLRNELARLASSLVQGMAQQLALSSDILRALGIQGILLLDSSSSGLPKEAKNRFPAPRNNVAPSAIKLHLCFDLLKATVHWFAFTPATTHDRKGFPPIETFAGKLIIFDLGYWDYALLAEIARAGAFFLSRVKINAVIRVVKVVSGLSATKLEGRLLFERPLPRVKQRIVEVLGEFSRQGQPVLTARVIGFWNPRSQQYHWYVTNLTAMARLIYPLYRLRWQLELVFKAFKSSLRLADLPSANSNIIYVLVYAALIAAMITYPLALAVALESKHEKQMTPSFQRAANVIVHLAKELATFLISASARAVEALTRKLKLLHRELYDPNYNRRRTSLARFLELARKSG
jgi:Transposase DDE domain